MLIKLLPNQVADHWEPIKSAIKASLPPVSQGAEDHMENVLNLLLIGDMHCWISYTSEGRVDNIATTQVIHDSVTGNKNLLIYSVFGFDVDQRSWAEGIQALIKYARSEGCDNIVGYTNVSSIVKFIQRIGGSAEYTFISIPVRDDV